uniref:Purinergic receptor P2X 6 n=1 Tax=Anser cygnoides TaxID=8845 RepID=A0A8B9DQY7_ANSCY
ELRRRPRAPRRHLGSRGRAPRRCHGGGRAVRRAARLQDGEVRADAEPAGGAAAPPAAARRPGLPARVGRPARRGSPPLPGTAGPGSPRRACRAARPQVGARGAEGLPGHGRGPPRLGHHQAEGGFGHPGEGRAQPALGRGRLREPTSGRRRAPAPAPAPAPGGSRPLLPQRPGGSGASVRRCGKGPVKGGSSAAGKDCDLRSETPCGKRSGANAALKTSSCLLGRKRALPGDQLHCHSQASPRHLSRGIKTGKCVMFNTTHSTCEIYGWCPVENNTLPRGNTLQTNDPTYFKSCTYDPFFNPSCPVFRIGDVVEAAGETFGDLALLGGSISIRIEWDCDLDQSTAQCQPQYSFILVDRRYNFRTASYYWDSQRRPYRSLMKLYGIRFDISVHGQAGKFGIIPAAVSFGTGIAFFGAATVVCDLVLLYLDTKADFYWKEKFEEAKPPKGKTEAAAEPQWADQDIRNAQ